MNKIIIEVSIGELLDKISILEIKKENVKKIKISVKNLLNFLEMFTFLMMIEQR